MLKLITNFLLGVILFAAFGCSNHIKLEITEMSEGFLELYLDEPNDVDLSLCTLEVAADPGYTNSLQLTGTMPADSYIVVWEEPGYTGPPVSAMYINPNVPNQQCAGIKVQEYFFGWNLRGNSFAVRISGDWSNFYGVKQKVDDKLAFGRRPRPALGGTFTEDTQLPLQVPNPPIGAIGRKWMGGNPIDNNLESDWKTDFISVCAPTQ